MKNWIAILSFALATTALTAANVSAQVPPGSKPGKPGVPPGWPKVKVQDNSLFVEAFPGCSRGYYVQKFGVKHGTFNKQFAFAKHYTGWTYHCWSYTFGHCYYCPRAAEWFRMNNKCYVKVTPQGVAGVKTAADVVPEPPSGAVWIAPITSVSFPISAVPEGAIWVAPYADSYFVPRVPRT